MDIKSIKARIDILKLAETLAKKSVISCGSELYEFEDKECPFCKAHDALRFYHETQSFTCFSCNASGDQVTLVQKMHSCTVGQALSWLNSSMNEIDISQDADAASASSMTHVCTPVGIPEPSEREWSLRRDAMEFYATRFNESTLAQSYQLERRRHQRHVLAEHRIGFSNGRLHEHLQQCGYSMEECQRAGLLTNNGRDMLPGGAYVYPHLNKDGHVCHFTFKHPDLQGQWQPPRESRLAGIAFYGEQTLGQSGGVALVEGENDWLSCVESDWRGPVLATIGQISKHQLAWLAEHLSGKEVITFFDHDEAGDRYRAKVLSVLPHAQQYKVPTPGSDIDEFLKSGGNFTTLMTRENLWVGRQDQPMPVVAARRPLDLAHASDVTNAELLVSRLDGKGRFVHGLEDWALCNDSGLWCFGQRPAVMRLAAQVGKAWREVAFDVPDAKESARLVSFANRSESASGINGMMQLAAITEDVSAVIADFDANPQLLGLTNGLLDLDSLIARSRQPEDMISRACTASWNNDASCPTWEAFLSNACDQGDEASTREFIAYLQRVCGAALLGYKGRRPFFFVYGPQGSGKSVFTNTLLEIMGDYGRALSSRALMVGRITGNDVMMPEIAALPGVRFCVIPEAGDENCFNDELLKAMTGGDSITARTLHQKPIEFVCSAVLMFVGNSQPSSSTGGAAFMSRIRVIGFEHSVPETQRDPLLPEKLLAESAGILRWMIEGAKCLRDQGWNEPEVVRYATRRYQQSVDVFSMFIAERTQRGPGMTVSKQETYSAFRAWAQENGYLAVKARRFATKMEENGYRECRPNGGVRCWEGIRLLADQVAGAGSESRSWRSSQAENGEAEGADYRL